ncbi:MAG: hypothetical protein FJX72_13315 [Armatimonadetes bacterium]|nr:hypothetical protein [Armatimonadota bacterium]
MLPLAQRKHKLRIEDIAVMPDMPSPDPPPHLAERVHRCAERIRQARANGRPAILTFGAHLIKNGLGPLLAHLIEKRWITHLATNGAGSIHDWEFAFAGRSAEDVRENTAAGRFGTWDETGRYIHLAIATGGALGLGYGESVGKMINDDHLHIPSADELRTRITDRLCRRDAVATVGGGGEGPATGSLGADADLLQLIERRNVPAGRVNVPHTWKRFSVQYAAFRHETPFTVHPGIGYDIIYTHPLASGGHVGRGAMRDFLTFAGSVSEMTGGVHIVIGSSVMAPMIYEKALSMANNVAVATGSPTVSDTYLVVVDIQDGGDWDWSQGEPPMDNPAYYLRFCKTFHRMGGTLDYICMDNAQFLPALCRELSR